jgi:hypothetical protein
MVYGESRYSGSFPVPGTPIGVEGNDKLRAAIDEVANLSETVGALVAENKLRNMEPK